MSLGVRRAGMRAHACSRYRRTLADLPWHEVRVRLNVSVRRLFCNVPGCSRRISTERLPKTAAPYARRTTRATNALDHCRCARRSSWRTARARAGFTAGPAALLAVLTSVTDVTDPHAPPARVVGAARRAALPWWSVHGARLGPSAPPEDRLGTWRSPGGDGAAVVTSPPGSSRRRRNG
jgi:hypothetical protein